MAMLPASDSVAVDGQIFANRYRIVRELGRGGMGVVVLAEDTRLQRPVALKFLRPDLDADPEARRRFLGEAQAAAGIDCPHVCTVYEASEADGRAYIAMAFIDGPTLKARLASGGLPVETVVMFARHVAAGLAAAHARGVVHRDVKSANVLIAPGEHATLTDFGLARVQRSADSTHTASMAGTLAYMSPEQVQGLATDHRADVWSFGCVVYEMLAGRTPFWTGGESPDIQAILQARPTPLAALRADAPRVLVAIVDRCLQQDPPRRYQGMPEILADLDALERSASRRSGGPVAPVTPSLVVLPFLDLSAERNQDYFAEGIAEEVIHALSKLHGVQVVARTSAFAFRGRNLDVREIGRLLDVGAVVEGSVRAAGTRLRITAQLIDVATGFHLWSERYDREAGDIFQIQDEITESIVNHLRVTLHVDEVTALQKRPTSDPEAYALYLKGQYFLVRPSPEAMQAALRYYHEALVRDPGFARAHVGIATVYAALGNLNMAAAVDAWPKATAALSRAFALDEDLLEAHVVAAVVAFNYEWDWTGAEAAFLRTLAMKPGDAFLHGTYAWFLLNRLRYDECVRTIKHAIALDPLSPLMYAWSVGLHAAVGRCDEALADFKEVVQIAPSFGLSYFHAGLAYFKAGRLAEAADAFDRAVEFGIDWGRAMRLMIRAVTGEQGIEAQLRTILAEPETPLTSWVALGWLAGYLGDRDTAFRLFDRARERRENLLIFVHNYTDMIAPALKGDPRYAALLRQLGLPRA
jgi:eukaryotic-like serine/threonine-protein kinase